VNPEQDAAYAADEVKAIAREIVDQPIPALLTLARTALTWHLPPHNQKLAKGLAGQAASSDRSMLDAATRVAVAAVKISGQPWDQRVRLQGAVVERIVFGLAEKRAPGRVVHEREVRLRAGNRMGRTWSRSKDVLVVDGDPFETYECKFGATFDDDDLAELADIRDSARDEGLVGASAVACLIGEIAVRARAGALTVPGSIRFASIENIAEVALEAPRRTF
jgi:hypothetical protein